MNAAVKLWTVWFPKRRSSVGGLSVTRHRQSVILLSRSRPLTRWSSYRYAMVSVGAHQATRYAVPREFEIPEKSGNPRRHCRSILLSASLQFTISCSRMLWYTERLAATWKKGASIYLWKPDGRWRALQRRWVCRRRGVSGGGKRTTPHMDAWSLLNLS